MVSNAYSVSPQILLIYASLWPDAIYPTPASFSPLWGCQYMELEPGSSCFEQTSLQYSFRTFVAEK